MSNVFVFRPGAPSGANVFSDWSQLMTALSSVEGRKVLEFDDSVTTCVIPPGPAPWPMRDVMWAGFGPQPTRPRSMVEISDGARFTDLRMIGGQITIVSKATTASPISDFQGRQHVQIGMRDDCGNTQIVNQGTVALFDLGTNPALFFVQNCLFGMPSPGLPSTFPLIRHTGAASQLFINLLGQNQTGPNVVRSEANASVLFGALSSAAQVAADQSEITSSGGIIRFGPIGRIQRLILPLPPAPPATSSQGPAEGLTQPNALLRCDGTAPAFSQTLPKIEGGFTIGATTVALYSGGQELVVAEVAGGRHLTVRPSPGDTIDGYVGLVPIGPHGSRTFVSDGMSNWITTSVVRRCRPRCPQPCPDFDEFLS